MRNTGASLCPCLCLLAALSLAAGPAAGEAAGAPVCFRAAAWPGADRLFTRDLHWLGADGAYSVHLGGERTLWVFGDTWINASGEGGRAAARMVRNTVAVQSGLDPSAASVRFHWRRGRDGEPVDFWPREDAQWYWPGHGVRLGDRLVVFLARQERIESGLGFRATGWDAVVIDNPDETPDRWRSRRIEGPRLPRDVVLSGGLMQEGGYVYALAPVPNAPDPPVYLARWPVGRLADGDLAAAEWWGGRREGWVTDVTASPPAPLFAGGQAELSIHRDAPSGRLVIVQTVGFGAADVALRFAAAPDGPWSDPARVYRPPEYGREGVLIYAAKAHPQLLGADLVLTYADNSLDFAEHVGNPAIYHPRFVRLTRCGPG